MESEPLWTSTFSLYEESESLLTRRRLLGCLAVCLTLMVVAFGISALVLATEVAEHRQSSKQPECPPVRTPLLRSFLLFNYVMVQGPTSNDGSVNDFPLYEAQPWDISTNHPRTLSFNTTQGAQCRKPPFRFPLLNKATPLRDLDERGRFS